MVQWGLRFCLLHVEQVDPSEKVSRAKVAKFSPQERLLSRDGQC